MKKLGFGLMRLPKLSEAATDIDHAQFCRMLDSFIERGFTYFDTAYMYHEGCSEKAVGADLVARHPRDSFTLADKLPTMFLNEKADMQRIFDEQRQKCRVDYFDYYLLHNLNYRLFEVAERLDAFDFIQRKKEAGDAREIGFSFHADAALLDKILTKYPFFDFVQLQINYLDWESSKVQSRLCYETARRHGKEIVIMEPVKGGTLARLPASAESILRAYAPDASPASFAIRFAAGLEGVRMVLSGMSDFSQLSDNIGYMDDFRPLCEKEHQLIREVQTILYKSIAIPCTGCSYCTEGCPQKMPIPAMFSLYNDVRRYENRDKKPEWGEEKEEVAPPDRAQYGKTGVLASDCIGCGQCEEQCPQSLPVIELLRAVAKEFEK